MHLTRWPVSLIALGAVAPLFLIQTIPSAGIWLMMLAAPYWPVLLINGAMIGVAAEAWRRSVSRVWLCLPTLWFGGYLAATGYSHARAAAIDLEITRSNAGKVVSFSPAEHSLVLVDSDPSGGVSVDQIAQTLVSEYGVAPVYVPNPNFGPQYLVYRRTPDPCSPIVADPPSYCRYRREPHRGVSRAPERPTGRVITIAAGPAKGTFKENEVRVPLTVTDGEGRTVRLEAGLIRPLSWWPQPVIGCGLTIYSWQCFATFVRGRPEGLGGRYFEGGSTAGVIAAALSVERR